MAPRTIAIFGAGVMGEALLSGLLRGGLSPAGGVHHRAATGSRREDPRYPQVGVLDNTEAARIADTLVLVVKPQDMAALLAEIAPDPPRHARHFAGRRYHLRDHRRGPALRTSGGAGDAQHPALVDEGMSAIAGGASCDPGTSTRPPG